MNKENESFEELYENSVKDVTLEKIVTGKIIEITSKGEIFVDLGYKADGIIPKKEYSDNEEADPKKEFKVGDEITAIVLKLNDGIGNVLLSYKKIKMQNARKEIEQKVKDNEIFSAKVEDVKEKGLIVNLQGIRVFIPISLSGISRDDGNIQDYKGKEVSFRITEYDPKNRRIIGSIKSVKDEEKKLMQDKIWNEIEIGKEFKGKVTSVSEYGAFVDIGGVSGLLHISELTWKKQANAKEIVSENQEITVIVKDFDKENRKLKLSCNLKGENPWETVNTRYQVGDVLNVRISKLMPFGAFAEIEDGIDGLIHISQISEKRINSPAEVLNVGDIVSARIIKIDLENKKMELSIKAMQEIEGNVIEND